MLVLELCCDLVVVRVESEIILGFDCREGFDDGKLLWFGL